MENFDPIDIEFLINEPDVQKSSQKVKEHLQGIGKESEDVVAKLQAQVNQLNQRLEQASSKSLPKVQQTARQWNSLGNSINQVTRELPNFAFNAQTGFLAISNNIPILADEIGRLRVQNAALAADGKATIPIWRQVASGLFSWNTALTVGVTLMTVFGAKIAGFIGDLFKTREELNATKKAQDALNKAFESAEYLRAIRNVNDLRASIRLAREGLIDKEVVVNQYNETIGKTTGQVTTLDEAEQQLVKNAPAFIEMMFYKAAAAQASADASKELAESAQKEYEINNKIAEKQVELDRARKRGVSSAQQAQGYFTNIDALSAEREQKQLQQDIIDLINERNKKQKESVDVVTILNKRAAELAKQYGFDFTGGQGKGGGTTVVNQRKTLLEKIADLDAEYARKQLERDEEELQALRDKFGKVRKLVEEFNQDPKNAKVRIDLEGLDALQQSAEADLGFKQQTRALKEELQEREKTYKAYEAAKKQFGIEAAREMYQGQLGEFDSYADLLRQKIADNEESFQAVSTGTNTAGQAERVRLLEQELKDERQAQQDSYNDLLASLQTYEEKRNRIISDYQARRAQLLAEGNTTAAGELKRQVEEQLADLDDAFAKNTDEYKALMRGVEGISETAARTVIDNARKMVAALQAAGQISEDLAREINDKINELEQEVNNNATDKLESIAGKIYEIADAFERLGNEVGYFDAGLGDTLATIGELGRVAGDAATSVAKFASGDILGGIASGINAITGIFSIARKARESARQAQAELLKLQQEAEDGERRLNALQRERNIAKAEEVQLTLANLAAQREALRLAQQQLQQDERLLLQQLQNEQFIVSSRTEKYGGFLGIGRKTRVVNEYADLLGLTFEEIEKLYERGQLTERAEELFQQLRDLKAEGEDINGMLNDLQQEASQIFTGTTSDAIADSIIEGLRRGYDSFQDFAGDIEKILQQAILNSVKYNLLEEPLQRLFEEFAAFAESDGQLSQAEANTIRERYNEQVQAAIDRYNQLQDVLNLDQLDTEAARGLSGAIRRDLTEATASELSGLFRGFYDITKQNYQLDERRLLLEERHLEAALDLLQSSARIEANTAATVRELQAAVGELKGINGNTKKSGASSRDIGR